ncbi:glucose-1-phosphate adenylyltransferase [Leptospirillum ferrooxidans]|jgi:glucose-1-phosphate adenylyltransferase|uniref:Glucose-1-phosphate adenylyltransferase n=1 Tax=Leptospirillum ferrooxidans (strain C2-3) TaxID=1162668 RepID=I0IRH7_LEPFC|nr:glucose-1-phosphate adenylyltransferase [Leptospirillum ferrooxidans]BAM07876.1 glucose-1-phosphate adenylyltransferase [Leptospirillum ferrooxidans C2-3]
MQNNYRALAIILAGGEGKRLFPLTRDRVKSAVPFGGAYRIIDFVLSNFVNSGLYKIKVLTQYKSHSLNTHLSRGWRLSPLLDQYVDPVPAQMRRGPHWFQGTGDAVYQNLNLILDDNPDFVCVFSGDHIFKMNISQMIEAHIQRNAQVTVSAIPVPIEEASAFGIVGMDSSGMATSFIEKPKHPAHMPGNPQMSLVSMGNYVFNTRLLIDVLTKDAQDKDSNHDFGKDILPKLTREGMVHVYDFSQNTIPGMTDLEQGYWKDIGQLDAYWQTHMDLVSVSPAFNLYNPNWVIRTYRPQVPPAKFVFADEENRRIGVATDSIVSGGCIISGGQIDRTILSPSVRINSYSRVSESILFDNVDIGRYSRINRAIIEKGVRIPPHTVIGEDPVEDRKRFHLSDSGVVVVTREDFNNNGDSS